MVSTTTIIGGLIGLGALYGVYRAFSGSGSTPASQPLVSMGDAYDATSPTMGGRKTHKRKLHGKKTKKHYLKK
jgi:hypothetical protein